MEPSKNIEDVPSTSQPKPDQEKLAVVHINGAPCTLDKTTCAYCMDPKNEINWDSRINFEPYGGNIVAEVEKLADFLKSQDYLRLAGRPIYNDSDSDSESQTEMHTIEASNATAIEPCTDLTNSSEKDIQK
jgi:hypothetical protein